MIEVIQALGLAILTYLAYKLVDLSISRFKSGKVRLRVAPKNLFEYLQPGSSIGKAKEILGEPITDTASIMIFKLKDLHVQIWKEDEKIQTICAVLPKFSLFNKYRIYPLKHKLGSVKVKDVIDEHSKIEYATSSKSGSAWLHSYFGNPGYYNHYTFGIFNGPGTLYPYAFPDLHVPIDELSQNTKELKFNYISISNKKGRGTDFDFHAMR